MIKINPKTQVLVLIGTGGVGKTTLAASMALGEAKQGKKVLVVTIDPSQRLAQALNFKPNGQMQEIKIDKSKGQLFATTLNHEEIFYSFLRKGFASTSDENIKNISKNKLFKKLSTQLANSQDFTTLYSLHQFVQSKKYDLIVLDTPPAQHTWSFLKAPEKLATLFSDEITSVFRKMNSESKNLSFLKKVVLSGTQQVTALLEKLTGSDFISELKSFFSLIEGWQSKLRETIFECQKILISPTTEFLLVCPFDKNQFLSAEEISRKIYNEGFNLHHMVINQVPDWLDEKQLKKNTQLDQFKSLYLSTLDDIKRQVTTTHKNLKVYKSFNISQNLRNEDLLKIYQNIALF